MADDEMVQMNTASPLRRHRPIGYVVRATGCWEWTASTNSKGYAQLRVAGKKELFHRLMYQRHVGPIPSAATIDHLCRNKLCGNPSHLEVTSRGENVRREWARRSRNAGGD